SAHECRVRSRAISGTGMDRRTFVATPGGSPHHVQILVFDDVEVLDFAGPFEVFGVTGLRTGPAPFRVETVGLSEAPIRARGGLLIQPSESIHQAGRCDVLILPGGLGARREMHNVALLEWIRRQAGTAEAVLS